MNTKLCIECSSRPVNRELGIDNRLCTPCFDYAGWENTHSDLGHDENNKYDECPVCQGEKPQPLERVLGRCNCSVSCAASTGRVFAQGHDARMVSRLRDEVLAGELTVGDATSQLRTRGGSDRLEVKLHLAIDNARTRKTKARTVGTAQINRAFSRATSAQATKVDTVQIDGFSLHASASASEPDVSRKVGRWIYSGAITEHRIVGEGKDDTVRVFRYVDKKGNKVATTKHTNPS